MDFSRRYNECIEKTADLSQYSNEELLELLHEAKDVQQEYKNLELIVKRDGNSLYGTSASIYFSLVDFDVAEDITQTGKHYTCIVDTAINKWLQEWDAAELAIIQEFYPDVQSLTKLLPTEDICVYGDTDSRYINLGKIFELIGKPIPEDNKELSDFGLFLVNRFINKIIADTIREDVAFRQGNPGYMKMAHEVTTRRCVYQAKKKYVMTVIYKDGLLLDKPKLVTKGVELKKGELNKRIKKILTVLVNKYMIDNYNEEQLRQECLKIMRYIKARKEKDFIYRISAVSGLRDIVKNEEGVYTSQKTHIQMKIAMSWMNFIERNSLQQEYKKPFEGQKMYYYYGIDGNVMGIPDDYDINNIKGLVDPDYNKMLKQILIKPLLKYIFDDNKITDTDVDNFLLGIIRLSA